MVGYHLRVLNSKFKKPLYVIRRPTGYCRFESCLLYKTKIEKIMKQKDKEINLNELDVLCAYEVGCSSEVMPAYRVEFFGGNLVHAPNWVIHLCRNLAKESTHPETGYIYESLNFSEGSHNGSMVMSMVYSNRWDDKARKVEMAFHGDWIVLIEGEIRVFSNESFKKSFKVLSKKS